MPFSNTEKLIQELKEADNPGYHIGIFLLQRSNSPLFLAEMLEVYLEAMKADLEAERETFRKLYQGKDKT